MDPQHICNKEQQQNMLAAVLWVCAKAQASHIYKLEILLQLKQTSEAQICDKNLYLKKLIFKKKIVPHGRESSLSGGGQDYQESRATLS